MTLFACKYVTDFVKTGTGLLNTKIKELTTATQVILLTTLDFFPKGCLLKE